MQRKFKFVLLAALVLPVAAYSNVAVASTQQTDTIKRVLILGNSITKHAPSPKIGWHGNWGMAASSIDKDYVHILERKLQLQNHNLIVDFANISAFETSFWKYDLSKLDSLKALQPDLVILRIGENVKQDSVEKFGFAAYYDSLISYFKKGNGQVKILSVSSFWKKDPVDQVMEAVSRRQHCSYLKLSHLSDDKSNMAIGMFEHSGVASHPSDKGMMAIADAIWDVIHTLVK